MDNYNDINLQSSFNNEMFNTKQGVTTKGVVVKSIIGLLITLVTMYFTIDFKLYLMLPFPILLVLAFVCPFAYVWFAGKTLTTQGLSQVLFWVFSLIVMGIFQGLCISSIILYYGLSSSNVAVNLDTILFLSILGTIALCIGGILYVPIILKSQKKLTVFNAIGKFLSRFCLGVAIVALVLTIISLITSLFGNTAVLNLYQYLFMDATLPAYIITILYLLFSVFFFMSNLIEIQEFKHDKNAEYYCSFLLVSGIVEIFYWLFRLILMIFSSNDNN